MGLERVPGETTMNPASKLIALSFVLLGSGPSLGAQEPTPARTEPPPPTTEQTPAKTEQAPSTTEPTPAKTFTPERLEQMAAPIALYPDPLIAQILMASTYPLEIIEASRWVEANPELKGAALEEALKQKEWDPSVKALCAVPTVLKKMSEYIPWTRDLGDAVLAQKADLMDTIQKMRSKALDAGTLKTTEQQTVAQDNGKIVVQPANPEVIYVPTYSPAVVYGPSWYYPSWYYPYWYDPWPWAFVSFGIGFWWGSCGWGSCDWHNHCCNVDCHQLDTFNARTSAHATPVNPAGSTGSTGNTTTWKHDPAHRAGVSYRNPQTAQQFGAAPGSTRVTSARTVASKSPTTSARSVPSGMGANSGARASDGAPTTSTASAPSVARDGGRGAGKPGTTPITRGPGMGPASGRVTTDPSRGAGRATAPMVAGASRGGSGAPSYRGSSGTTYRTAPSSSRGTSYRGGGSMTGYRSSTFGRTSGGWSGTGRGSSGSFGGGRSFSGGGGGFSRGGGSFGGGGHGGSFGGRGFGGGGFHGGGHR